MVKSSDECRIAACVAAERAIATGGQAIRNELARLEPVVRDGGFFPCCDHGVPSDVSRPAFLDYARRLAQMTGWL
ncbi:MAG: hypothetical protein KGY99_09835 [Phycisphaerae bacterium]|nr:hypothetical protein [Phycisphaerae bacterium]